MSNLTLIGKIFTSGDTMVDAGSGAANTASKQVIPTEDVWGYAGSVNVLTIPRVVRVGDTSENSWGINALGSDSAFSEAIWKRSFSGLDMVPGENYILQIEKMVGAITFSDTYLGSTQKSTMTCTVHIVSASGAIIDSHQLCSASSNVGTRTFSYSEDILRYEFNLPEDGAALWLSVRWIGWGTAYGSLLTWVNTPPYGEGYSQWFGFIGAGLYKTGEYIPSFDDEDSGDPPIQDVNYRALGPYWPYKEDPREGISYTVCRDFDHISRYKGLRQIVHERSSANRYITLEAPNAFHTHADVIYYIVPLTEENRLDLIANRLLGSPLYAWTIAYLNGIEDGFSVHEGQRLMVLKNFMSLFNKNEILASIPALQLMLGEE